MPSARPSNKIREPSLDLKIGRDRGQSAGKESIRLRPIGLSDLPWGTPSPVDLFQAVGNDLVLLFPSKSTIQIEAYPEISRQTAKLYYNKEAKIDWLGLVESNLPGILQSPLPVQAKAQVAYGSATRITQKVFEEFTEETYKEVQVTVDAMNRLLDEPDALQYFFELTIHDYYTYTHSLHVFLYASMLTRAVLGEMDPAFRNDLGIGYLLHDIGKKDIDLKILTKSGPLTEEEWKVIKMHPQMGFDILIQVMGGLSEEVTEIVLQHHERLNGSGYPNGLKGIEMGRFSRMCTIADAFDAITTERSYKKKISRMSAFTILKSSTEQFDEKLLSRFINLAMRTMNDLE